MPESIRQVITLGSPIHLERTDQSNAHMVYDHWSEHHIEQLDMPLERGQGPLPVPTTSIYSRLDGIVAWRTCLNRRSAQAENIEICGSHFGFGHHPAALWAIVDRLSQPPDNWQPFSPPTVVRAAYPTPEYAPNEEPGLDGHRIAS
jgi:hypothetical protein